MLRPRLLPLIALAAVVACLPVAAASAQATEAPPAPMSEAAFIALASQEPASPGGENTPPDPSRPFEPARPVDDPSPKPREDADDGSGAGGDADPESAGGGDDDDLSVEDLPDTPITGDPDDSTDDDDDATAAPSTEQAFLDKLRAAGVTPTLEDIPEEARPLVEKKLKDFEKGFTKAMQEVRADQKAAVAFKAEDRFRREKPVDFLVNMLLEHPELAVSVNARLDELDGNATAVEGHRALVEQARQAATAAEETTVGADDKTDAQVSKIVSLGKKYAKAAGVPFDMGVEDAIAAHVAVHRTISEKQIATLVQQKAVVYRRQMRQGNRDKAGQYARSKATDHRTAGLPIKPGVGATPMPGAKAMPKNDAEFIAEFVSRGT